MMDKNFDWSKTNRELVLLIPNFGRKKYIDIFLSRLITDMWYCKDKWMILIINDGIYESFDDWKKEVSNIDYLTIERNNPWERGDGFSRNVAIKYCQSKLLAQKDPEILYTGDFIKGCLEHPDELYRCGKYIYQADEKNTNLFMENKINMDQIKNRSRQIPIMEDRFVFYHYGYCIKTEILRNIGGYDESYKYYCYADMDLHERLTKHGIKQYFDYNCQPIHLWHPKPDTKNDPVAIKRENKNKEIYNSKKNGSIIRNVGLDWGEGDPNYIPEIIYG